jgi:ribosomal protein S12 methylthiotransferase accessory factor
MAASDVEDALNRLRQLRAMVRSGEPIERGVLSRRMLQEVLPKLGITRVGDLTELDTLSIPVWFASRPGSRSVCVSNGKGLTEDGAWISAVMESAEQELAEQAARLVEFVGTPDDLARRGLQSIALERQARCAAQRIDDRELAWVRGMSWTSGEDVYAPYELIGLDMASEAPWDHGTFRMTSTGLASGADLLQAVLHGLEELVEDDAVFVPLAGRPAQMAALTVPLSRHHDALIRTIGRGPRGTPGSGPEPIDLHFGRARRPVRRRVWTRAAAGHQSPVWRP